MRLARPVLALLLACTMLSGTTGPASAGEKTRYWNNKSQVPAGHGYASVEVTFNFVNKRTFYYEGVLNDVCPADGYTATVNVGVWRGDSITYYNTKGCEGGRVSFRARPTSLPRKSPPIRNVIISLCLRNLSGGQSAPEVMCEQKVFHNPHV